MNIFIAGRLVMAKANARPPLLCGCQACPASHVKKDPEGSLHFCWGQKDLKAGTQRENIQLVLSLLLKWVLGTGGEQRQRSQENCFIYP